MKPREPELNVKGRAAREHILKSFWASHVGDVIDNNSRIQTKAEFSPAVAVVDKTGSWKEARDTEIGGTLVASS